MKQKKENILWIVLAVAIVAFVGYSFFTDNLEHIEDTNGADNYALCVITDENIIKRDMGAMGYSRERSFFNDGVTVSADKFTGVEVILSTNFILPSDFDIDITNFYVEGGNFKMAVVNKDEIVAVIQPGELMTDCRVENITGYTALVIAGESAAFTFYIDGYDYEMYGGEEF